jgi:hypothetical protein
LHYIEGGIELGGSRLGCEEQGRGNENQDAVDGYERHAFDLRTDQPRPRSSLCKRKARAARCDKRRNQQQEARWYSCLDGCDRRLRRKQLSKRRRKPEDRNRQEGERAATGWIILTILLILFLSFPQALCGYATQMPGTATFWNRCGEATAEDGWAESFALNSGCVNAAR